RLGTLEAGYLDAHAAEIATAAEAEAEAGQADGSAGAGPPAAADQAGAADVPDGYVAVRAPLTGTVVSVTVAAGRAVGSGDELLVLEAMKMEHEVRAQAAGRVAEV